MSAAREEITRPELRRQDAKELPRREGTFEALVEQAEADPTPEEVVATAEQDHDHDEGGPQ